MTVHRFAIAALLTSIIAVACLSGGLLLSVSTFQHDLRQFAQQSDGQRISSTHPLPLDLLRKDRATVSSDRIAEFDRLVQRREALTNETPFSVGATLMQAPLYQITISAALLIGGFVALVFLLPRFLLPRYILPVNRRHSPFDPMVKSKEYPVTMSEIIVVALFGAMSSLAGFTTLNTVLASLPFAALTDLHPAWIGGIALLAGAFSEDAAVHIQRVGRALVTPPGRS